VQQEHGRAAAQRRWNGATVFTGGADQEQAATQRSETYEQQAQQRSSEEAAPHLNVDAEFHRENFPEP
jgi:hypothetical protein